MEIERRAAVLEVRAAGRRLEGIAAPFGVETRVGSITEVIAPGAFSQTLAEGADVLGLLDHDAGKLLGRTRSGTLRLREESRGLSFAIDLPSTTIGNDVLALAERGDLGGMSFGFVVRKGGEAWSGDRRELRNVDLREVSVIQSFPAYPTEINLRNRPTGDDFEGRMRAALLRRWRP
jgi:HK97 family phage prohead protease